MTEPRKLLVTLEVETSVPIYKMRQAHLLVTGEVPDIHAVKVRVRNVEEVKAKRPRGRKLHGE